MTDSTVLRLQVISFFLVGFLACAALVMLLWNYLQRDFKSLPRLSYGKALVGVFLWGLVFVIVLTMISGARELMTPGAWKKQGFTYQLTEGVAPGAEPNPESARRQHLEKLRTALWQFAATHNGRFPTEEEVTAIPRELWEVPDAGGIRYLYVPSQNAGHLGQLLAFEPELDTGQRLVLKTNGDVLMMSSAEVQALRGQGKAP